MQTTFQGFFAQYGPIDTSELKAIGSSTLAKAIAKGDFLLKEGAICDSFYLVKSGCFRLYYLKEGLDTSVWFSFENNSCIELYSYISQSPSEYFMECIEAGEVLRIPKARLEALCASHPNLDQLFKKYWLDVVQTLINRLTSLQKYTAEERYLQLMEDTHYLHRIPQKYLASYIGVTSTSLSRIRRNIQAKLS